MASIVEFSRLSAILTLDISQFLRNSEIAQKRMVKLGTTASRVGGTISRGFGLVFALLGGVAVKAASDFSEANSRLRALVKDGTFEELSNQARTLGETTVFTQQEIANTQFELKKLGTTGRELLNILPGIANLSGALGEDLTTSATAVREALNIYRLESSQAQRVTDLFASAVANSALTIGSLREGFKNVGPILQAQNLSIEDSVALLALLANNAIKGSLGGTKLRSTFNKLGATFSDGNKSLALLQKNTLNYTDLLSLLNSRSVVVGSIIKSQSSELDDLKIKFNNATASASAFADELEGELFFSVGQIKNAINSLGIELGAALKPAVEGMRDALVGMAKNFRELDPAAKEMFGVLLIGIPVVGAMTFALGQLAIAAAALTSVFGLVVALVGALGLAFAYDSYIVNKYQGQALRAAEATEDLRESLDGFTNGPKKGTAQDYLSIFIKTNKAIEKTYTQADKLLEREFQLRDMLFLTPTQQKELALIQDNLVAIRGQREALRDLGGAALTNLSAVSTQEDAYKRMLDFAVEVKSAEAERVLITKEEESRLAKIEKINERIRDIVRDRQTDLIPVDLDKTIQKVNDQFKDLEQQILALDGDLSVLNRFKQILIDLEKDEAAKGLADFTADLKDMSDQVGSSDIEQTLNGIQKGIKRLKEEATAKGAGPEVFLLIDEYESKQSIEAWQDYWSKAIETAEKGSRKVAGYVGTDLENQITAVRQKGEELLKIEGLTQSQRIAIQEETNSRVEELEKEAAQKTQRLALRQLSVLVQFTNVLGKSFADSLTSGKNFFKGLGDFFLQFFQRIIAKLIALVALFAILTVLSGGTSAIAGVAQSALGGQNLGQFITTGFTGGGAGGGGGTPGFRLAGDDLVMSTQRSGRSLTRIG